MRRRSRPGPDHLNRYWIALLQGAPPEELARLAEPLDPAMVETIRRMRAGRTGPRPNPAFARRLERDLVGTFTTPARLGTVPLRLAPRRPVNGRTEAVPPRTRWAPTSRWSHRRARTWVTCAAILLVVGAGYLAVRANVPEPPRRLPAADGPTATPGPAGIVERALVEFPVPEDALPNGDTTSASLAHIVIPVGVRSTWEPTCCPGLLVEYVVAGEYAVRAGASILVWRGYGTTETIPAGTEVVLGPGDGLFSRNETAVEGANVGAHPVDLLSWIAIENPDGIYGGHQLPGWEVGRHDVTGTQAIPPNPATIRLRRIDLAPGAVVPAQPGIVPLAISLPTTGAGTPTDVAPSFGKGNTRTIVNAGSGPLTVYALTLEPALGPVGPSTAGTPTP